MLAVIINYHENISISVDTAAFNVSLASTQIQRQYLASKRARKNTSGSSLQRCDDEPYFEDETETPALSSPPPNVVLPTAFQ
jgi:hypothetical protein